MSADYGIMDVNNKYYVELQALKVWGPTRALRAWGTRHLSRSSSLKTLFPFLHDAQMHFSIAMKLQDQINAAVQVRSLKQLGILHVDYALKLLSVMKLNLSNKDLTCLEKIRELRDQNATDINDKKSLPIENKSQKLDTNQLLLVEADAVLAIAEEQLKHGFRINAMLNFHFLNVL